MGRCINQHDTLGSNYRWDGNTHSMVHAAVNMIPGIPSEICMAVLALVDLWGLRDTPPPGPIFFFKFYEVFGKMAKIIDWCTPFRVRNSHLGNPGSATEFDFIHR